MRYGSHFNCRITDISIAEALAVINGIHSGLRDQVILPGDEILIQTDNDSVMTILNGEAKRRVKGSTKLRRNISWRKLRKEVGEKNAQIRSAHIKFTSFIEDHNLTIRWRHVKGHEGMKDRRSAVNTICDHIARDHMIIARSKKLPSYASYVSQREKVAASG